MTRHSHIRSDRHTSKTLTRRAASDSHARPDLHDVALERARRARATTIAALLGRMPVGPSVSVAGLTLSGLFVVGLYSAIDAQYGGGLNAYWLDLAVFVAAAVSSVAGFAFSALCGAVLFHSGMARIQIVESMLVASIAIQCVMLISLLRVVRWRTVGRFLFSGLVGLPVGILVLLHVNSHVFTRSVGALLCVYAAYMICRRPVVLPRWADRADPVIGFVGGLTGGAVAFPGAPVTAWCQLKGWSRDQQRGVYQPYILLMQAAALAMMPLMSHGSGFHAGVAAHDLLVIPPALAGAMIGLFVYRKCTDRGFLVILNVMLMLSGLSLLL